MDFEEAMVDVLLAEEDGEDIVVGLVADSVIEDPVSNQKCSPSLTYGVETFLNFSYAPVASSIARFQRVLTCSFRKCRT